MKTLIKRHYYIAVFLSVLASLFSSTTYAQAPLSSNNDTVEIGKISEFYLSAWGGVSNPIDAPLTDTSGTFLPDLSSDNTAVGGIAVGLGIAPNFRFEVELASQRLLSKAQGEVQTDEGTSSALGLQVNSDISRLMFNGYFDLHINPRCAFYLMGGVGAALTNSEQWLWLNSNSEIIDRTEGASSANFAWQLGIGQSIFIGKHVVLDLGTRLFNAGKVKSEAIGNDSLPELGTDAKRFRFSTQEWLLGLRLRF